MPEIPSPHNSGPQNRHSVYSRITGFLDGLLQEDLVQRLRFPKHLRSGYNLLDETGKREWLEFTSHQLLKISALSLEERLKRKLKPAESGLVKRRVINFLKHAEKAGG